MSIWGAIKAAAQTITGEWDFTGGLKVNGTSVQTTLDKKDEYINWKASARVAVSDIYPFDTSTLSHSQNRIYFFPFIAKKNCTILGAGFVRTSAGTNYRLGIWDANPSNDRPLNLLAQQGSTTLTGSGVYREAAAAASLTVNKYYYVSLLFDAATTLAVLTGDSLILQINNNSGILEYVRGYTASFTYGTMPSDTSGLTLNVYDNNPAHLIIAINALT